MALSIRIYEGETGTRHGLGSGETCPSELIQVDSRGGCVHLFVEGTPLVERGEEKGDTGAMRMVLKGKSSRLTMFCQRYN